MISNAELLTQVQISQDIGELQPSLTDSIIDIVNALATHPNYRDRFYLEDMKQSAILACCKQWSNFRSDLSNNPLAYFIQVCQCAFTREIHAYQTNQRWISYSKSL